MRRVFIASTREKTVVIHRPCDCEHKTHFNHFCDKHHEPRRGHRYGRLMVEADMHHVKTVFGVFVVCTYCRNNCLAKAVVS